MTIYRNVAAVPEDFDLFALVVPQSTSNILTTTAAQLYTEETTQLCEGRLTSKSEVSCSCLGAIPNCHTCTVLLQKAIPETCQVCRNQHYLFSGTCLEECPKGYVGRGSGSFNRICRQLSIEEKTSTLLTTMPVPQPTSQSVIGTSSATATDGSESSNINYVTDTLSSALASTTMIGVSFVVIASGNERLEAAFDADILLLRLDNITLEECKAKCLGDLTCNALYYLTNRQGMIVCRLLTTGSDNIIQTPGLNGITLLKVKNTSPIP